jgi:hypothetical protein
MGAVGRRACIGKLKATQQLLVRFLARVPLPLSLFAPLLTRRTQLRTPPARQFKLNERFELDVAISLTGSQPAGPGAPGAIATAGHIDVLVDIPPPFSFMPRHVLQATGNTAMQTTLTSMLVRDSPGVGSGVSLVLPARPDQHIRQPVPASNWINQIGDGDVQATPLRTASAMLLLAGSVHVIACAGLFPLGGHRTKGTGKLSMQQPATASNSSWTDNRKPWALDVRVPTGQKN